MIKRRAFGKTGVEVSEVGLGAWPLGGRTIIGGQPVTYGEVAEDEARRIIDTALELGINLIDTADTYGLGRSERVIGRALKGKRDQVFIATKACWIPDKEKVFFRDISYHNLMATCDRSLMRLDTDHVDFFQVHDGPRDEKETDIFARVFSELKKSGKARFCGASVGDVCDEGIRLIETGVADGIQLYYNILTRAPEDKLLPLCREKGIGVLVAVPMAQGILTGKYRKGTRFADDDVRSKTADAHDKRIEQVEHLRFLERTGEQTMAQAALRFCLANPAVSAVIPGARTVAQIKANASASGKDLSKEDMDRISQLCPVGP